METTAQRPTNPDLAKLFDKHLHAGDTIRYADDTQMIVWHPTGIGCAGLIGLIIIGMLTLFIVPVILLVLGALNPSGQLITYTVQDNGKIKKKSRPASKN